MEHKWPQPIYRALRSLDRKFKLTDPQYPVAAILLASRIQGANVDLIADYLKLPLDEVATVAARFWKNEIWKGSELVADWAKHPDDPDSGLGFWLDVSVGAGQLNRSLKPDGTPTYGMTDEGVEYVETKLLKR